MTTHHQSPPSQEKQSQETEVSIWLDTYDNMFSDFDPRPYSHRTLSDDFIFQARKMTRDRSGQRITLKLLLPEGSRNKRDEEVIAQRLHLYFVKNYKQLREGRKRNRRKGITLIVSGLVLMVAAGYISFLNPEAFAVHLLLILFEPAGWFLFWTGLDHLFYYSRQARAELEFYAKMIMAEVTFGTY